MLCHYVESVAAAYMSPFKRLALDKHVSSYIKAKLREHSTNVIAPVLEVKVCVCVCACVCVCVCSKPVISIVFYLGNLSRREVERSDYATAGV